MAKIFSGDVGNIIGTRIIGVRRFGKGLVIDLDNGFSIAVHVKMTGQLIYERVSKVSRVPKVSRAFLKIALDTHDTHGTLTTRLLSIGSV